MYSWEEWVCVAVENKAFVMHLFVFFGARNSSGRNAVMMKPGFLQIQPQSCKFAKLQHLSMDVWFQMACSPRQMLYGVACMLRFGRGHRWTLVSWSSCKHCWYNKDAQGNMSLYASNFLQCTFDMSSLLLMVFNPSYANNCSLPKGKLALLGSVISTVYRQNLAYM